MDIKTQLLCFGNDNINIISIFNKFDNIFKKYAWIDLFYTILTI
jgi:hypothetical protein